MKNANIGIANLIVSNKLKDSYFSNDLIQESQELTTGFFDVVKNSPILQLEFKVFSNLENKIIESDLAATRYIDGNIKLFEVYTISEIEKEHEKLKPFLPESVTNSDKVQLYNAIDTLIIESLNDYDKIDVDGIHESFTLVLNHIKSPKKQLVENKISTETINEDVIEIAIGKFNEKYDGLDESDKLLLKTLIKSNESEKEELLETYKSETLNLLEEGVLEDEIKEKLSKTIQKIREMKYNPQSFTDDIIGLHELKKELL